MITIIRIKSVSECMRIRRAAVTYILKKNQTISLLDCPHPLKKFKDVTILDNTIKVLDNSDILQFDKEVFFHKYNQVDTGNGYEQEVMALGAIMINIDEGIIEYYKEQISNNCVLDQWNGEYEYLVGLFYEYEKKDIEEANIWYQKALNKRFIFEIKE